MFVALACLLLAVVALQWDRSLARERVLVGRVGALDARVAELSRRVEAAEADVAHTLTQVEIAESLLVEKGVADEEDIEAIRRRLDDDAPGPRAREELN